MPETGIKQRRTYSRDWMPAADDPWFDQQNATRYFAWKRRLRDHPVVGSDQVRQRVVTEPLFLDDFLGNVAKTEWTKQTTAPAAAIKNGVARLSGTASDYMHFAGAYVLDYTQTARMEVRAYVDSITTVRLRFGLCNAIPALPSVQAPTSNYIWFDYNAAGAGVNWAVACDSAGTPTTGSTGTAGVANTYVTFEIDVASIGGTVTAVFSMDGTIKNTIATNVPTTLLQPFFVCETGNNGFVDKVTLWVQKR